jgi:hypothetical protein
VLDIYRPWFTAGFDQAAGKEDVIWELVFGLAQTQTPQGVESVPMLLVYAHIKAATLGDYHTFTGQLPALGLTPEVVDRETRKVVDELLKTRSAALYKGNGKGKAASSLWPGPKG